MKRTASTPRSYLRQLAAPLPPRSDLLHARRPTARGASTVLSAIPRVVDSVDADSVASSVNTARVAGRFDRSAGVAPPAAGDVSPQVLPDAAPKVVAGVRAAGGAELVRSEPVRLPTMRDSALVRPAAVSGRAEDVSEAVAARVMRSDTSAPSYEAVAKVSARSRTEPAPQQSSQTQSDAVPQRERVALRPALAESSQPLGPSPMQHPVEFNGTGDQSTGGQSSRGVQVHIGTVEVRIAAPAVASQQPVVTHRRDTLPSRIGRPAQAEPLSRGLTWSHGLVQG